MRKKEEDRELKIAIYWRIILILFCVGVYLAIRFLIGHGYFEAAARTIHGKGKFRVKLQRERRRMIRKRGY